jgi:hypothetical protein
LNIQVPYQEKLRRSYRRLKNQRSANFRFLQKCVAESLFYIDKAGF